MLRRRLSLVHALQCAIGALVQAPQAVHRQPLQAHLAENAPQRAHRALQDGGVGDIKVPSKGLKELWEGGRVAEEWSAWA